MQQWRLFGDVDLKRDRLFVGKTRIYVAHNAFGTDDEETDESSDSEMEPLHLVCYRLDS